MLQQGPALTLAALDEPQVFRAQFNATCNAHVRWDFGDGTLGEGLAVQHAFTAGGLYDVAATVSCDASCRDTSAAGVAMTFVPESIHPVELTFSREGGLKDVLQDDNGEPYQAPHWVDRDLLDGEPATTPSDDNFPVTYPRGSPMQIEAVFEINPAPPAALAVGFVIEGEGPEGILMEGASIGTTGTEVTFTTDSGNTKLPDHIDKLSLPIVWRLTGDGGLSWHNAGRTQSRVYVTLAEPLEDASLFETVLDVGCREAEGLSASQAVVDAIWEELKSLRVERKDRTGFNVPDGQVLSYWVDANSSDLLFVQKSCFLLESMLSNQVTPGGVIGVGTCGAWSDFLIETLKGQGIGGAQKVKVVADPSVNDKASGFLVKNWSFGAHIRTGDDTLDSNPEVDLDFSICQAGQVIEGKTDVKCVFPGRNGSLDTTARGNDRAVDGFFRGEPVGEDYPYLLFVAENADLGVEVGDAVPLDGVRAQGPNANPPSRFFNHFVVRFAGQIFDPSYGLGPLSEEEHEQEAIDGIFAFVPLGGGGEGLAVKKNDTRKELLYCEVSTSAEGSVDGQ